MAEPLEYSRLEAQARADARGRITAIITRCVGGLLVAAAGLLLFGAGLGLDRDPGLMTIEILGFIGVPVTGVGVIKVRLTRPYALGWANAGVLLLWPFFGFWSFLLIADIIRHGVGHWDGGDLMEVAPPIFLIVTTCLVVRLNYINHWGFAAKPAS